MRFKIFEKALIVGVLTAVIMCFFSVSAQDSVSDKLIRLHVKANSDEPYDQELKLMVRDAVLSEIKSRVSDKDLSAARSELIGMLPEIQKTAEDTLKANDADYPVRAAFSTQFFPTRVYQDFALPSGDYETLYIEIGKGAGQNWWCVVFPPLCMAAAEGESVGDAAEAAGFTKDDLSFITEENSGYKIEFKIAELYGDIKHRLMN